jgi:hypothetical protein
MLYMNEYEIAGAEALAESEGWKVTLDAIATLKRLIEWADTHSDGWAYWPKPAQAARQLMERIQDQERKARSSYPKYDMTYNERDAALRPIKAFITRQISGGGADESDRRFILEGVRS